MASKTRSGREPEKAGEAPPSAASDVDEDFRRWAGNDPVVLWALIRDLLRELRELSEDNKGLRKRVNALGGLAGALSGHQMEPYVKRNVAAHFLKLDPTNVAASSFLTAIEDAAVLRAQENAHKSHLDDKKIKASALDWCAGHLKNYATVQAAAEALARVEPIKISTAKTYIREFKKNLAAKNSNDLGVSLPADWIPKDVAVRSNPPINQSVNCR